MRKPERPERMYLDFDGFFASCEQFAHPHLRGRPVGIVPMVKGSSCVIAASREAKAMGVKNVMPLNEAMRVCPDIVLWPQNPDLYRRAHNELISEINCVVPVDAVKSIDELTCRLDPGQTFDPLAVGVEIKRRLAVIAGPWISCSIGYAANRLLAKMACKDSKPAGNLAWHPADTETILATKKLDDVPGIGTRRLQKLWKCDVYSMPELLTKGPRELRAIWGSLLGERMWYALHGYDIQAQPSQRGMYGHGRILPPSHRTLPDVREVARILLVKAARRMRRDGYRAGALMLGFTQTTFDGYSQWGRATWLPEVNDYIAILHGLDRLWKLATAEYSGNPIFQVSVTLGELTPAGVRQLDLWEEADAERVEQESLSAAMDKLNHRYAGTVVSHGPWKLPPGDNLGMKISYTRIPRAEDRY